MSAKTVMTSAALLLATTLFASAQVTQPLQPGNHPATEAPQGAEQLPPSAQQPSNMQRRAPGTIGQGNQRDLPENQRVDPPRQPQPPLKDLQEQRN